MYVNFTCLKYFSLTTVALVNNLSPLITALFGVIFLHEKLDTAQIVTILVAFSCVLLMVYGAPTTTSEESQ
jgi:drug/metabolite transporter (DMT)-like permease